jgi:hypothetical protein
MPTYLCHKAKQSLYYVENWIASSPGYQDIITGMLTVFQSGAFVINVI